MDGSVQSFSARLRLLRSAERLQASKALTDIFAQISAAPAPRTAEETALQADAALQLGMLARSLREAVLIQRALAALLSLGCFGRAQASLFVQARTLPLAQLTPIITTLPARTVLTLLNTLLQDQPPGDKQYAAWLKSLLPAPGRLEPRESLVFLKTLAAEGTTLAPALRELLLAGALPAAMLQSLAGSPSPGTAEALLRASEILGAPALAQASLDHALRTAGRPGPSRLNPLLAAEHDHPGRDTLLALEMRRLAAHADAPALLATTLCGEPEVLGLVLAQMLSGTKTEAKAALRLLPLLPLNGLDACLDALPPEIQPQALGTVFAAQVRTEPDFLRRFAKTKASALRPELLDALKVCLQRLPAPPPQEPAPVRTPGPDAAPQATARQSAMAENFTGTLPLKDADLSGVVISSQTVEGRTFSSVTLSHGVFEAVVLRRMRLSSCLLAGARFTNCVFQACAFTATDMSHAVFQSCRFDACTFEGCDLSGARLAASALTGCSLTDCTLLGAEWTEARLVNTSTRGCALSGMRLRSCAMDRCAHSRTDLSGGFWHKSICRDTEFTTCSLARTTLSHCETVGLRLAQTDTSGLVVQGGHTNDPAVELARQRTLAGLISAQALPPLPPALLQDEGAAFVWVCVMARLRVDEARRTLCAMRAQNRRRREMAEERLTPEQSQFLALLPVLLATDVLEQALGIQGVPAITLADSTSERGPSQAELAQLAKLFPKHTPASAPRPVLRIEAVYAIGSLGSVAQKSSSDVDCWVCYTPDEPSQAAVTGLKHKLSALEGWAMQQYGLEVHFFAMPLAEVRGNAFGMSDKESSGSAQALLLKEEFYRTALKIAGRDLAWWAAPPGANDETVRLMLAELADLAPRLAHELIDLGQPAPIPPGEYFGACLWQMVKAVHSPYKSVMKLALLEKYAGQGQAMRLLCERIKEAALRGRKRPEDLDPYLALFASTSKHYAALADSASLDLLCECLLLKADVDPAVLPPELVRKEGIPQDAGTFAHSLRLGGMVGRFMIDAYRRIQAGLRQGEGSAHISPEDMTRLGRRIAVNFSQSEHKVALVPFLSEGLRFTELFFYAEKAPGKRTIWAVKGKEKDTGKAAVESLAPIRRDTDPSRLLAWLAINGIADLGQTVHAEKTLAPIAIMDVQALLAELTGFFPRVETLAPDMDEYLRPERVTRACIVLNLPVAQDKNKIMHASVIYATNWGELCCQSFANPDPLLAKSPLAYLSENLAKPVPGDIECTVFVPKRSACPRIKIL